MKEREIWKKHRSGLLVSNMGQVFVPKSGSNKEHYTYGTEINGYLQVQYNKKERLVHDLVYETFHNIELNSLQVHHKNSDTKDNRLENLIALSEEKHRKIHGTKRSKPVLQFTPDDKFIQEWPSTKEIQRQLGFNHSDISHACIHNHKSHGYIWRYKDQET